jgi:PAS domain S-box-containing protein
MLQVEEIESQLELYKLRYNALFNNNHAVMLLVDTRTAQIINANPAACKYYGWSHSEITGMKITDINILPESEVLKEMELAREEKRNHFLFKHRLANGEIRDVEVYSGPIEIDNHELLYSIVHDISERRKTELTLHKTKEELERFFTIALDLLCIANTKGEFLRINSEWENVLGYKLSELEGHSFLDFVHPEDKEATINAISILDKQKPVLSFINRYRCKDGSYRFIEWKSHPQGELIYAAARDITEYVNVDRELRKTLTKLQEFQNIINRSPIVVTIVNTSTTPWSTSFISENVKDIIGYTAEEFLSDEVNWVKICHPDDVEIFLSNARKYGEGGIERGEHEYRLITKSGDVKWFKSIDNWANSDPNTCRIEVIVVDITDQKKSEEKIKAQVEELSRISTEKDKFFSIISHDLRSPFQGFLGFTQIIAEQFNELSLKEIEKFALQLQRSAKNLYDLLYNLLSWSLVQRDKVVFIPQILDVQELINSIVKLSESSLNKKELKMNVSIEKGCSVYADKQMLNTIVRNIVSNAIKFTHRGGRIEISAATKEDGFVVFSIVDTGVGMSQEVINKLFSLGSKISTLGTEGEPSTGLGLILCKDFINKNGGEFHIFSEPGKGSRFSFTVPSSKNVDNVF